MIKLTSIFVLAPLFFIAIFGFLFFGSMDDGMICPLSLVNAEHCQNYIATLEHHILSLKSIMLVYVVSAMVFVFLFISFLRLSENIFHDKFNFAYRKDIIIQDNFYILRKILYWLSLHNKYRYFAKMAHFAV